MNKLHNVDISSIPTDTALKAKEWIKQVQNSDQVKCVSMAGYQIHIWVRVCTRKIPKYSDTRKIAVIILNFEQRNIGPVSLT